MKASYKDFGFYTVNTDYLKLLSEADNEVYYSATEEYARKPFLGIVVLLNGYSYFLTPQGVRKFAALPQDDRHSYL